MDSILDTVAGFLAAQSAQIFLVFLLVFVSCWFLRHASAHWRYLLWLVVIAKCITPPIVALSLPVLPAQTARTSTLPKRVIITRPISSTPIASAPEADDGADSRLDPPSSELANSRAPVQTAALTDSVPARQFSLSQIVAMAWTLVAGALLVVMAVRMAVIHRKLNRQRRLADDATCEAIANLASSLGFRNPPRVYQIDFTAQPFVWGWLRGDIYLPAKFSQSGSSEQRQAILTHELAHVARWDAGINHLQNIVQAIFFFHPLVWWANRKLRQEREKCCDEIVLASSGASPKTYCSAIVDMLAQECAARTATPGLTVTGSTKNIKERIVTMLTPNRTFLPRPSRATIVTLLLFAACVLPTALIVTSQRGSALADDQASTAKTPVELKPFKLTLVDEAKNPVPGALVTAAGLRIEESPSSGCSWPTNVASKNEFVTDQNGVVEIQYPVKFGAPGSWMTTTRLIFRARHADFAGAEIEVDVASGNAMHGLTPGCRAVFRGVDSKGTAISDFAIHLTAGRSGDPIWKRKPGELSSSGLSEGKLQAMLVSPSADGVHRFSDLLTLTSRTGQEAIFNDVELRPGMQIRGELSKNVPRPIKNGTVYAWCLPKPAGESYSDEPSLGWGERASISKEGTFEFSSLPRGGKIYFIALCDGWVVEGVENGQVIGKEMTIAPTQLLANRLDGVVLPMKPTASAEIEVLDPDGKPLRGATVSCWPNQSMKLCGATVLGNCYPYIRVMESQIAGAPVPKADLSANPRYNQKTDEKGKVILRDIPVGAPQRLHVGYENLAMKPNADPYGDHIRLEFDSATLKKRTVKMVRIKESSDAVSKPADVQETKLDVTMNKPDAGFDVPPLTTEEMLKVLKERKLSVSPEAKKAILDYMEKMESVPEEIKKTVQGLRNGAETMTLQDLAPLLQDKNAQSISTILAEHQDPVVRFAATLFMASNGDAKATQALHKLIHDKSVPKTDRQVIGCWCNGVGIRATDSPADITEHFANVTRTEPKFKKGDAAPEFELETVSGVKIASKDLRGKVIVLHFWATSCGPCMSSMEMHIKSLSRHDSREVEIVFVSLDDEKDKFIEAVKKYKMPFKNVRDERGWGGELCRQFGVHQLPFDVVIDAEGKIASNSIDEVDILLTR